MFRRVIWGKRGGGSRFQSGTFIALMFGCWLDCGLVNAAEPTSAPRYRIDQPSQPLSEWRRKGWIHVDDPRGWFQWYCRYYSGRRHQDDLRQIKRWRAVRRHLAQLKKHCVPRDLNCRRRQRQALLHWAYDSRKV